MKTRAQLEAEIADDLERSDLTTQIAAAVETAILYYEKERFDFNSVIEASVTLSSSTNYIALTALPYKFFRFDRVAVVHDTQNTYEVTKRTYSYIKPRREMQVFAEPQDYAIYAQRLLFDCGDSSNRTILLDGIVSLANTVSGSFTFTASSTAAWFNDARPLIRAYAKAELYTHVIKDMELASDMVGAVRIAYDMLTGRNNAFVATGQLEPTRF